MKMTAVRLRNGWAYAAVRDRKRTPPGAFFFVAFYVVAAAAGGYPAAGTQTGFQRRMGLRAACTSSGRPMGIWWGAVCMVSASSNALLYSIRSTSAA